MGGTRPGTKENPLRGRETAGGTERGLRGYRAPAQGRERRLRPDGADAGGLRGDQGDGGGSSRYRAPDGGGAPFPPQRPRSVGPRGGRGGGKPDRPDAGGGSRVRR